MSYAEFKEAVIKKLKTNDLVAFPEVEIDEYVKKEESWLAERYADTKKSADSGVATWESLVSGVAYGMGLAF